MIEIEADLTPVQRLLDRLINTCSDGQLGGSLSTIGDRIVHNTKQRILKGVSPDGTAFETLSDVTVEIRRRKGRGGTRPLIDTGELVGNTGSISYRLTGDGVVITASRAGAAAVHGGSNRAGRGNKVKIPPRPFMGVTDEDYDYIREVIQDVLDKAVGGEK